MTTRRDSLRALGAFALMAAGIGFADEAEAAKKKRAAAKKTTPKKAAPQKAAAPAYLPDVSSIVVLVQAEGFKVLSADEPHARRTPASVTKLMTLCLMFEALDNGTLKLEDKITMSHGRPGGGVLGLAPGKKISVADAILAIAVKSANDVSLSVAEHMAGSEEAFAARMTKKARALGMNSTTFTNASGLPDKRQVTTARDLATLAQAMLRDFPHYYPLFSVQEYVYGGRPLRNHNQMLGWYPGLDGIKTGYINASGFNVVTSAMRDGRRLIGVVLGGSTPSDRDATMGDALDRGFERAATLKLAQYRPARPPAGAKYTSINFAPGAVIPGEAPRTTLTARAVPQPSSSAEFDSRTPASGDANVESGKWSIQLGAFGSSQQAAQSVQRAMTLLPDLRASARATIDTVQVNGKMMHRVRLTNLDEQRAIKSCKRLEQAHVACAPINLGLGMTQN